MDDKYNRDELNERIRNLESMVAELKSQLNDVEDTQPAEDVKPVEVAASIAEIQPAEDLPPAADVPPVNKPVDNTYTGSKTTPERTTPPRPKPTAPVAKRSSTNLENKIGHTIMGIIASVLVFLSLVFLGFAIYDHLTDAIKIGFMFIFSAALTVTGLLLKKKDITSKAFSTTLAGCGVGALYISLMLTYYIFNAIPMAGLIVCILIWIIFSAILSRLAAPVFIYVCYAGLTISTLLAAKEWNSSPISLLFYVIGIGVLFTLNFKKEYNKNAFFLIQLPIIATILAYMYSGNAIILLLILFVVLIVLLAPNLIFDFEPYNDKILIPVTVLNYLFLILLEDRFGDSIPDAAIKSALCLIAVAITVVYYFAHKADGKNRTPFLVSLYFSAFILLVFCEKWLLIPAIVFIVLGLITDNEHLRYASYIFFALIVFGCRHAFPSSLLDDKGLTTLLVIFVLLTVMIFTLGHKLQTPDSYACLAIVMLIPMVMSHNDIIDPSLMILALAVITYTFKKTNLPILVGYIINGVLMLFTLFFIAIYKEELILLNPISGTKWIATTILILSGIAIFAHNTLKLYDTTKISANVIGFYIPAKFTILLSTILNRFDVKGFIISVICICAAVICVIAGIKCKNKQFRLFGLLLVLLSVAKLLIIDIDYRTSPMWPLAFLAAGILCFGISLLYSKLEKKQSENDKNDNGI